MRRTAILLVVSVACSGAREVAPIRLDAAETFGVEEGDGVMASWPRVSPRHPLGYRVLVPQPGGAAGLPGVFGDDGAFLGSLGAGTDTARFTEPLFVRFGPADSLYVFDGASKILVFSPDRQYARTIPLSITPWDGAVLADGRIIVSSALHDHALPLLLLRPDGSVEREIGLGDSASAATSSPRRVVLGPDGTVWTMPMAGRWRLEQWNLDGSLLRAFDRTPDWYAPYQRQIALASGTARHPTLQDLWFDGSGRLWVLGKAVDDGWEKGDDGEPERDSTGSVRIDDPDKVSDTVIEVFDASGANLVATARFDAVYPFAVEPGTLMRVRTEGRGWHRAELARIVLDTTQLARTRP